MPEIRNSFRSRSEMSKVWFTMCPQVGHSPCCFRMKPSGKIKSAKRGLGIGFSRVLLESRSCGRFGYIGKGVESMLVNVFFLFILFQTYTFKVHN